MEVVGLEIAHKEWRLPKVTGGTVQNFCDQKAVNYSGYLLQLLRGKSHAHGKGLSWPRSHFLVCILQPALA